MAEASTRRERLAAALVELAALRADPRDSSGTLSGADPGDWRAQRLARAGVEVLQATAAVVLTRDDTGKLRAAASYAISKETISDDPASDDPASDDPASLRAASVESSWLVGASRLLALELADGEGPGIQALRRDGQVVMDLVVDRGLWPTWTAAAVASGWLGVVAVPLRIAGPAVGALELLRRDPDPPTEPDLIWARALAGVTAAAVAHERALRQERLLAEQLQAALDSRVLIEQAKGILGERGRIEVGEAFDRLRRYARAHRKRLADVARDVVDGRLADAVLRTDHPDPPDLPRAGGPCGG
jgi:GAF domain-containing protein